MSARDDCEFELSRLIDGDLSVEAAARLRATLERDAVLRDAHAALTRVDTLVRTAAGPLPEGIDWAAFRREVSARIASDRIVRSRRRMRIRVFAPLAAAAAVALFVSFRPTAPAPAGPLIQVAYAPTESVALPSGTLVASAAERGVVASYEPPMAPVTSKPAGTPRRAFIVVSVGGRGS